MQDNTDGVFKDFNNNKSCATIEEWQEYIATTSLTHEGITDCSGCGAPNLTLNYTGMLQKTKQHDPPALCDTCKTQLLGVPKNG